MRGPSLGWQRPLLAALLFGAILAACESAEQPRPFCTVRRDAYAARFQLLSGSGPCAELKGEVLGAQAYLPDPDLPDDRYSMAIQSAALGQRIQAGRAANPQVLPMDVDAKPYAWGKFSADRPDESNICRVETMSQAELRQGPLPEIPAVEGAQAQAAQPAIDVAYRWTGVQSYVTTAITGVVWGAELEYQLNGCTATYKVVALAPVVECGVNGMPDDSLCGGPDPDKGFLGSGLNPDIAVNCHPDLLLCVAAQDFPSLK